MIASISRWTARCSVALLFCLAASTGSAAVLLSWSFTQTVSGKEYAFSGRAEHASTGTTAVVNFVAIKQSVSLRLRHPADGGTWWYAGVAYEGALCPVNLGGRGWTAGAIEVEVQFSGGAWRPIGVLFYNGSAVTGGTAPTTDPYRKLSFTLTNSSAVWKWGGIFSSETPGVMQMAQRVGPGASLTWDVSVLPSDSNHYYAAFVDAAASVNAEQVTNTFADDSTSTYYRGVVPDVTTATASQQGTTSQTGIATNTNPAVPFINSGATGNLGGGPITGNGQTTTGTPDAATNAQLSAVGNAIAKTVTDTAAAIQGTMVNGVKTVVTQVDLTTAAVNGVGGKVDAATSAITGLRSVVETGNANTAALRTIAESQKTYDDAARAESSNVAKYTAKWTEQGTTASAVINAMGSNVGTEAPSVPKGSNAAFTIEIAGYTFNLDPAADPGIASAANWFRLFLVWALSAGYAWWAWGQMQTIIANMAMTPQARGNTVAGTGGQLTAFVAAGVITVGIFTAIPLIWGAASGPATTTSAFYTTASSWTGGYSASVAGALYLIDFFLPVPFIMSLVAQAFFFRKFAMGACLGVYMGIKYIVP